MKATVTYYDVINDVETIECNGHSLGFGGVGDGYCYAHQTFDCIEHLTDEEIAAIQSAEYEGKS